MIKLLTYTIALILLFSFYALGQNRKSDRETDGLKGLVKAVFTERTDLKKTSGKLTESKRRPESEYSYDKIGNRLTWKNYDYSSGHLFESVIYSRIDGDKVSIYEEVENPNKITAVAPNGKPQKPFDPRYDYKFKYQYDRNGNVSEEAWYQSNGELWLRYVYNFKENQREELVYSADGSLNQKYIYTLDGKGNEIEMLVYDAESNKLEGKETYKYLELDAKGNWTKRITSEADEETNFVLKPREALYRKITYF